MAEERQTASARVQLTLDIDVGGGGWGADCTVAQVHKQAADSATGLIHQLLDCYRQHKGRLDGRVSIVGTPKISAVIASVER